MFDEVPVYALAGGLLASAFIVAIFLLFMRRFYCKKRSKTDAGLENATAAATDVSGWDDYSSKRCLANYGAVCPPATGDKDTRTMDQSEPKSLSSMQSVQQLSRSPASRQKSLPPRGPYDNALFEECDEGVDGSPKGDSPLTKSAGRSARANSGSGDLRRQGSTSTECSIGSIKPDLYLRKGSLYFQTGEGGDTASIGKIHLRLRYDFRRSDFLVTAIQAELPSGVHECYLRMFLTPEESDSAAAGGNQKSCRQSTVRRRSAAFAFNEEFKFPVAFTELVEKTLVVQAFDCSPRSAATRANQQLGEVSLELRKADPSADIEVLADLSKTGDNEDVYGSMEVALCYLPSVQRLTVSILQAKGLQAEDLLSECAANTISIYVRCWLYQNGNKSAMKRKKSSAVSVTIPQAQPPRLDACWKEQLTFHLTEASSKSATLRILVCAKQAKGGLEKVLGELDLSSEQTNRRCRQHWKQMLKEKMESSAWHKLQMPAPSEAWMRRDSTLVHGQEGD